MAERTSQKRNKPAASAKKSEAVKSASSRGRSRKTEETKNCD